MAEETDLCSSWLYSTLAADSAGAGSLGVLSSGITDRIYDSLADQDQMTFPLIVFNMQTAAGDLMLNNARRVWARYLFQVKVIGEGHAYSELSPIASRIDTLIHRGSGSPTGGTIISCTRGRFEDGDGQTIRYAENIDGLIYRHLGGLYSIIAQAT